MNAKRSLFSVVCFATTMIVELSHAVAQPRAWPSAEAEQALLKTETRAALTEQAEWDVAWKTVLDKCGSDESLSAAPVRRAIKGHAYLAVNRNNESVCMFLTLATREDRERYEEWAVEFARQNAASAVAQYLKGDSLARLERWPEAIEAFSQGLGLRAGHPLILNARGAAYARTGEFSLARLDFQGAIHHAARPLADTHANIGALCIEKKDGAEGAFRELNRALAISPSFALARHGRGTIRLVYRPESELTGDTTRTPVGSEAHGTGPGVSPTSEQLAANDLEVAQENAGCAAAALAEDLLNIEAYKSGTTKGELLAELSGKDVRASLRRSFNVVDNWAVNPTQGNWNKIIKGYEGLSTGDRNMLKNHFQDRLGSNSDLARKARIQGSAGVMTNSDGNVFREVFKNAPTNLTIKGFGAGTDTFRNIIQQQDRRRDIHGMFKDLATDHQIKAGQSSGLLPEGVMAGFPLCDEGEWPFNAYYGLCYQTTPAQSASKTKEAAR